MSIADSNLESFLASIVESSDDAIIGKSLDGVVTSWNRAAERIFGYSADEMIGRPISVLAVPERYEDMRRIIETIRRGDRVDHYETVRRTKDGRTIHVSLTVSPIRDHEGRIIGASKIARDITERKLAEEARGQAEERLRLALEAGRMMAWDLDLTTGEAVTSRGTQVSTGPAAQSGRWAIPDVHPDDSERVETALRRAVAGEAPFDVEYRLVSSAGVPCWVNDRAVVLRDDRGEAKRVLGIRTDITERKRFQDTLRENQERMTLAERAARLGVFDIDLGTGRAVWSSEMEALHGLPPGGFEGHFEDWLRRVHPDDRARVESRLNQAVHQGHFSDDYRILRPDGELRWIHSRATVFLDGDGSPRRILGVNVDITERKLAEHEKATLLEEVRQAVRRRDQFLAMLAHELRNPLAPLRNSIHLLRLKGDDPSVVGRVREMMERQITHLGRLVDDLLDVSRMTRGIVALERERTDLAQLARQAAEDYRGPFESSGVALTVTIPEIPVWVSGDRTRLVQVLENLLENARKFTDPGGTIDVQVDADREAGRARLQVRDTGIGIEPGMLPTLFDVFSQADQGLERRRGGLGLGLALVKRLVQLHGGEVEARSGGLGQGSEFRVVLPLEDEPMALSEPMPRAGGPRKRLRVLVVEDNLDSAESLRMLLASQGYEVTLAHSGTEGVELAHRAHPDVIVCDIGLPGMDGYAVARAIRKDPETRGVRLIAVTGYGQDEDRDRALESGFDTHLVKPADPERLLSLMS
jgi:PAS domain S-box-containing protein